MFRSRYFRMSVVASVLFLGGCGTDDEVPSKLSFSLEGTAKDFSKSISVMKNWVTDSIEIEGLSSDGESLTLSLKKVGTGTFTHADYDPGASITAPQYQLRYKDAKKNAYSFYPDQIGTSFQINMKTFDNSHGGEVSGSFGGVLGGSILNGIGTPTTVTITDGVFSYGLESAVE